MANNQKGAKMEEYPKSNQMISGSLNRDITISKRTQLLELKRHLQEKLMEVDDAIKALDENPGVERVLTFLRKVGI